MNLPEWAVLLISFGVPASAFIAASIQVRCIDRKLARDARKQLQELNALYVNGREPDPYEVLNVVMASVSGIYGTPNQSEEAQR